MTEVIDKIRIKQVFDAQRDNRLALKRATVAERTSRLSRLRDALTRYAEEADEALHADLRKPRAGAKNGEVVSVLAEIDETIANLADWVADEHVAPSAYLGGKEAYTHYEPRGVVLLLGPWNFPFGLVFSPLVPIIAAGNACIIKPNELQPATSALVAKIIADVFPENEVAVCEGGIPMAEALQDLPFDHVFFTGSPAVGKRVMAAAARHLSSVTLELGGKCPAIIDDDYPLATAAASIIGARMMNAGQLCLAVDHVWVPRARRDELVALLCGVIDTMFYHDGVLQKDRLSRLVDLRNFERVKGYIDDAVARGATAVKGGGAESADLTIHPTVLIDVPLDARIMQDEIFGPVLPVVTYETVAEIALHVDRTGKPLALYPFSNDPQFVADILERTSSGGVTINGVIMHYVETKLPFGGVNGSGIGRYHGVHGFRELSHARAVFRQS